MTADIHGRADRFHEVLDALRFSKDDELFVLGDVIDRNPDGIVILEEIMSAGNVHMILGNHEYMMVNAVEDPGFRINDRFTNLDLWYLNGGAVTEAAFKKLKRSRRKEILDYIRDLPLNIELSRGGRRYLLAHGSPVSAYGKGGGQYADETEYAVWNRFDPQTDAFDPSVTLICGHTPTVYLQPKYPMEVFRARNMLFIDCGCAYPTAEGGRLACLCLETGRIIYSTV